MLCLIRASIIFFLLIASSCGADKKAIDGPVSSNQGEHNIEELIKHLGDADCNQRTVAQKELAEIGEMAEPLLKEAVLSPDKGISSRAEFLLSLILVKKIGRFSDAFSKEFHDVHNHIANLSAADRFKLFKRMVGGPVGNKLFRVSKIGDEEPISVSNKDIISLIDIMLWDGGQRLDVEQKITILNECNSFPETVQYVMSLLNDEDASVRCKAIGVLGLIGEDKATYKIKVIAYDKNNKVEVRAKALITLVELEENTESVITELLALLKVVNNDICLRWTILTTLAKLKVKEVEPELRKLIYGPELFLEQKTNAFWLWVRAYKEATIPELYKMLNSDIGMESYIAAALGSYGNEDAIPILIKLMNEKWQARDVSIESLAELGAKEALPEIRKFLVITDTDKYGAKLKAIEAVGKLGDKESISVLMKLLTEDELSDKNQRLKILLAEALAQLGAKEAIPEIMRLIKYRNKAGNYYVAMDFYIDMVKALGKLAPEEAIKHAINILRTEKEYIWAVVNIIVDLKAREVLPELINLLYADNKENYRQIIDAISQLGGEKEVPHIKKFLNDDDWQVRRCAINALLKLNAKDSIPELTIALKDEVFYVRGLSAVTLFKFGVKKDLTLNEVMDIKYIIRRGDEDERKRCQDVLGWLDKNN